MRIVKSILICVLLVLSVGVSVKISSANPCTLNCWRVISSPSPGSVNSVLHSVSAVKDNDVWAVGFQETFVREALAEHWDGTSWSPVPIPSGLKYNEIYGVSMLNATRGWAVGYQNLNGALGDDGDSAAGAGAQTLIERWFDSQWVRWPSPNPGALVNVLKSVYTISETDAWAVGLKTEGEIDPYKTLILHWDGVAWNPVASPNVGTHDFLYSVSFTSPYDGWAVGYYSIGSTKFTLTMHWDGSNWSIIPSPNGLGSLNGLSGVTAIASNDVWAVGYAGNAPQYRTLAMHWDGSQWSIFSSQNPASGTNTFIAVAHLSPTYISAVGYYDQPPFQTLNEVSGGPGGIPIPNWKQVKTENVGMYNNVLRGIAVVPGSDPVTGGTLWAVGHYSTSPDPFDPRDRTLIEQYVIPSNCCAP